MILLPLYTAYLPPDAYGQVEIVTAATAVLAIVLAARDRERVLPLLLRREGAASSCTVVRTSFWFTMAMATVGLVLGFVFATPIAHCSGSATTRGSCAPAPSGSGRRRTTSS